MTRNLKWLLCGLAGLAVCCLSSSSHFTTVAANIISTIDAGGSHSSSANYVNDGSVGGVAGISTVASPAETVKAGYIGQLHEVASLSVTGSPNSVNEGANAQLSGTATMDDDSVTVLYGADVSWGAYAYPIAGISGSGVAATTNVYATTAGIFSGHYLGAMGNGILEVLDSDPDNYGTYAGDGLPDGWQVGYFGSPPNANARPSVDADGDGQNNQFEYVAGTEPTNNASLFALRVENVTGQPDQKRLVFSPRWAERTYTPQFRTNLLAAGSYGELTDVQTSDNQTERTVTDLSAMQPAKFYRIQITLP